MKVKNKPGKKLLAMLLAGAMALAMLPVFIIPASGSDIFRDIFGEPDARVVPGAAAGKLPYRDGAPLLTVCEPLVGGVGMGEKNFIFGQYGTLGMEPTAANGYTARALPGGSEFWLGDYTLEETERTNVSLKRVLKLYEGNFNGDGRKNQLAVLCLANVRIGSDDSLDVVLFVCNADDNRWMTPVASFGRVDTKTGDADYVKDLFYCYDLACADLDGDGFDEIIVAPKGKSHLSVFSLIAGADWQTWEASGGWKAPVNVPFGDPTYNAGQTSAPSASDLAMGSKGMTFSMAVGDVDRDGCEDIVYVASGTKKGDFTGAYRSAYVLYGDKTLSKLSEANQQQKLNIDMQEGNGKGSNEGQRAFGRFGVTIASMPGGPPDKETKLPAGSEPRIFLAFEEYNNLDFNGKSDTCRCHYYSIGSLRFVSRSSSFQWSFVCRRENTLNGGSDPVRYLDQRKHTAALKINYLMYGYGLHDTNTVKTNNPYAWGSLLVNGELTPFAVSLGEAKSNVYQTGDSRNLYNKDKGIDFNREVFSQRACTVTGDGDGVMVHWLDGGKRYIKYFDCSTDTAKNSEGESTYQGYKEVPALSMEAKSSDWLYFALPDVNNDSLFLKFQRHEFFWSDPRVAAALASPPYYDSLPNAQGATTFGQIVQSANGTTKAYSDSAGAYVSLEGKLGCELFKVVVEAEVAYDHTWTNETEKMSTVTYSIEKSAPAGTDVVLLATNAFDVYTYTLYSPTGDNPTGRYGEEDYVVVVPRNDRYASKLIDVSYDEYKEFRRNDTKDILPDLSEVFTHTPGKPETYPETTPAFAENTLLSIPSQYPRVSSTALSIETTEEVTNTKLESNTVSAKLGIGFEAGSDKIGGVKAMVGGTYAHDWTNGKITSNATGVYTGGEIYRQEDSKIGFGVELIRYTYTNNPEKLPGKETYGFPVVTYLLSDVQQPDGTAPDGAVYVYALGDNGGIVEEAYPSAPNNVKYHVTAPGVTGNSSTMLVGAPEGMTLATGNIASADEDFTIALDSHVKPGTYKLKLMVGGKESNEFKLTVTPRKYDLRVANKNTGETQPLQSVKGGDWVDVDVSAWKGGSTYFMWTNDDADLINAKHTQKEIAGGEGFHRTQPVLRFRMPGQDLNLEADFHGHPEDIARIRCVDLGDYSGGTRITNEPARSSLHTQGVNAALLWADFGNGLDGAAYTRVRADADYAPDVTWTLDGSYTGSGAATGIEASGAILGSPSAILTLGSGELSEKITVTATSKATGIKKSIAIPIDQPKLAVTANPSPVIFTADEPGYTAADLSKKVNLFNNNSMSGVAADGSITFKECTMAGDDPAAFQLATSLAGTTLKARQEKPIFVCPAAGLTEGMYTAILRIRYEYKDSNSKVVSETLSIPLSFQVLPQSIQPLIVNPLQAYSSLTVGYAAGSFQSVYVQNFDGTRPITGLTAVLNADQFTITEGFAETPATLDKLKFANIGVAIKPGLPAGFYTGTLTISGDNCETVTVQLAANVKDIDYDVPSGEITIGANKYTLSPSYSSYSSGFYKSPKHVTITGKDGYGSPAAALAYCLDSRDLRGSEVAALPSSAWKAYPSGGFDLPVGTNAYVYARVTDSRRNVAYVKSGLTVIYTDSEILGSVNRTFYEGTDAELSMVLNGNTVGKVVDSRGTTLRQGNDYECYRNAFVLRSTYLDLTDATSVTVSFNPLGVPYPSGPAEGSEPPATAVIPVMQTKIPSITTLTVEQGSSTKLIATVYAARYTLSGYVQFFQDIDSNTYSLGGAELVNGVAILPDASIIQGSTLRAVYPGTGIIEGSSYTLDDFDRNKQAQDPIKVIEYGGGSLINEEYPHLPLNIPYGKKVRLDIEGGSGDGELTYHSSNPAVGPIEGDELTIIGLGQFYIYATKAGDDSYNEAVSQALSLRGVKRAVTLQATIREKEYDGTKDAEIEGPVTLLGVLEGDEVFPDPGTAQFTDKNAGEDKTVELAMFSLYGLDFAKYELKPDVYGVQGSAKATIKPRKLTVHASINDKRFDGLDTATMSGMYELPGVVSGDIVSLGMPLPTPSFSSAQPGYGIPILFSQAFSITGQDVSNYEFTQPSITADIYPGFTAVRGIDYTTTPLNDDGWCGGDYVIAAMPGCQISLAMDGPWADTLPAYTAETDDGVVDFYCRYKYNGNQYVLSAEKEEKYKLDRTAPTGTITVKANEWKTFLGTVSFGLFYKNNADVTISADDALSGVADIAYYLSDTALGGATVWDELIWTHSGTFSIPASFKGMIYARIADYAGNTIVINSDGIVVYDDSEAVTASVSFVKGSGKDQAASVALNGNTIQTIMNGAAALTAGSDYTVSGGTITFKASWLETLAQGGYTLTVYYNPLGEVFAAGDAPATTAIALTVLPAGAPTYDISVTAPAIASGGAYLFPGEAIGYAPVTATGFTILNQGEPAPDADMTDLNVALSGAGAGNFTLDKTGLKTALAVDDDTAFTIRPNDGLAEGTYTAAVTITDTNITDYTFTVSFTVTDVPIYAITVTTDGNGTASASAASAAAGTEITLTATPDSGYQFKEWQVISGGVTITGNKFTMPAGTVELKAVFEAIPPATYAITVTSGGNGTASASAASAAAGTEITLTATPDSGYQFKEWQVISGGVTVTGNKFTMPTGTVEIKAVFEAIPPATYAITVTSGGNGTASASAASATAGTEITLTASPDSGYQFKEWQVVSGGVTVTGNKFTMPAGTVEIKAVFEAIPLATYAITVTTDGNGTASASAASAAAGTEITLTATPDSGHQFKEWQVVGGGVTITGNKFTMPTGTVEIKAVFELIPPATYAITVTSGGNGTASASAASATQGTEITLTATPDSGYQFKEWQVISGGVTVTGNKFTMPTGTVEIKAVFEAIPTGTYTVTVNNGTGGGSYTAGATVTITANAAPAGQEFDKWVTTDVTLRNPSVASLSFTMPAGAVTVTATYKALPPSAYVVTVTSGGNGTASASAASAAAGTEITLTASPDSGYQFKEWQVISGGVTVTGNKFTMPAGTVEIKAVFELIPPSTYAVTVNNGTGGGSYAAGATVTITANAAPAGQEFDKWVATGVTLRNPSVASLSFTMPAGAVTVTATYKVLPPATYAITITSGGNGTASASAASAAAGTEITLTATPDSGYQFKEWQVISGGVTVTGSKFTMPAGTVEIKAVFEAIFSATYTVTVNNGTGGGSYAAGATVTITANAAPAGQEFDKWVATGVTLRNPSVASLSFTMPVGAVTVTATYKALPPSAYVITVTSGGNGTASASAASATQGTEITLTATPDSGYQFKEWQVISGGVTVTGNKFTMPASNVIVKAIFEANGAAIVAPTIAPDKNVTLHYRGETQLNNFVTGDGLTWSSSNPKYVTVDPNTGKITSQKSFIKTGSATITAQNSAGKVVFNVKVRPTFWQWILIIVLFGWIWY